MVAVVFVFVVNGNDGGGGSADVFLYMLCIGDPPVSIRVLASPSVFLVLLYEGYICSCCCYYCCYVLEIVLFH